MLGWYLDEIRTPNTISGNERNLLDAGTFFSVETFAFGSIAFHCLIEFITFHGMTPFLIINMLPLFILHPAEFAFLTPESDVGN